jgi:hypothetical protein
MNPDRLLERITRATDAATSGSSDDPRAGSFARGMVLGALVGAAIAGSTIWQRRQSRIEAEAALSGELKAEHPLPGPRA